MTHPLAKKVELLAIAENRLWQITDEKHFAEIPAKTVKIDDKKVSIISGEEVVKRIDSFFAKKGVVFIEKYENLDFLKDPQVTRFLQVHAHDKTQTANGAEYKKDVAKDFLGYANQYKVILDAKAGMNPLLAEKTIAAVDNLYPDGKYLPFVFNRINAYSAATNIELQDAKGLSHQLHHDNKEIPRDKAYTLALELLKSNKIPDAHKIVKGTALHVPEHLLDEVYALPKKPAAASKTHQK